jgi:hypothetical protein
VNISATNDGGTGTASLTINIAPAAPPPQITSATQASSDEGSSFSYQITATNQPTSYGASGLPPNLSINPSTGLISGTTTQSGTFNVGLSATNESGTGTAGLQLTVFAVP